MDEQQPACARPSLIHNEHVLDGFSHVQTGQTARRGDLEPGLVDRTQCLACPVDGTPLKKGASRKKRIGERQGQGYVRLFFNALLVVVLHSGRKRKRNFAALSEQHSR